MDSGFDALIVISTAPKWPFKICDKELCWDSIFNLIQLFILGISYTEWATSKRPPQPEPGTILCCDSGTPNCDILYYVWSLNSKKKNPNNSSRTMLNAGLNTRLSPFHTFIFAVWIQRRQWFNWYRISAHASRDHSLDGVFEILHNPLKSASALFIVNPKILDLILFVRLTSVTTVGFELEGTG